MYVYRTHAKRFLFNFVMPDLVSNDYEKPEYKPWIT